MKIRNGFVSNSSSSSFIIRGAEYTTKELIEFLNIESEVQEYLEEDDLYEVMETIESKLPSGLKVKPTGNIFDSYDYDNLLVGKDYGYLEDGGVVELDEHTTESDKEITDQLESVGIKSKKLRTYVQMISNDNY